MTINIPCKIGDTVWAIRNHSGTKVIRSGKVSEMYFIEKMRLCIVVKNISRGEWGKVVFATAEEARQAIDQNRNELH